MLLYRSDPICSGDYRYRTGLRVSQEPPNPVKSFDRFESEKKESFRMRHDRWPIFNRLVLCEPVRTRQQADIFPDDNEAFVTTPLSRDRHVKLTISERARRGGNSELFYTVEITVLLISPFNGEPTFSPWLWCINTLARN